LVRPSSVSLLRGLGLIAVGVCLAGCRTPATQVMLALDTDVPATRAMELTIASVRGVVPSSELPALFARRALSVVTLRRGPGGSITLPGSIGLLPAGAGDVTPVTVWIRARVEASASAPETRIERVAVLPFVRGSAGEARVFLPIRCGDRAVGCTSAPDAECTVAVRCRERNATCGDDGACVPTVVPVAFDGGVASVDASEPVPTSSLRLLSPMSGSDVTTDLPNLRWSSALSSTSVVLELCRDRACLDPIAERSVTGTSARPDAPLPRGRMIFWRVRGTGSDGDVTSATWVLRTPVINRGAERVGRASLDVNGDGFADLAVAAPGALGGRGRVYVHLGGPSGVNPRAVSVLDGHADASQPGLVLAAAGDVNGDGYGDLAVGAPSADRVDVYFGGRFGLPRIPSQTLGPSTAGEAFGAAIAQAGDVDVDGYGDLVVGSPRAGDSQAGPAGKIDVFRGSPTGLSAASHLTHLGEEGSQLGSALVALGDLDGDGRGAFAAGAPFGRPGSMASGRVWLSVSRGGLALLSAAIPGERVGAGIAAADFDGDGLIDLAIGAPGPASGAGDPGRVTLLDRTSMGFSVRGTFIGAQPGDQAGAAVAGLGDVDGDGFDDFAVGAPRANTGAGAAWLISGAVMGLSEGQRRILAGAGGGFASTIAAVGDLNGDGFADCAIGAPGPAGGAEGSGLVQVRYGRAGDPLGDASILTLRGEANADAFGAGIAGP
jgi:hypothetical protein